MADVDVRPGVVEQYRYYADGASEWRRLGALDKAANIAALCRQVPVSSVLEIGAGDGSILTRLSELGFGEALYAAEISRSGVSVIEPRGIPRLVECRLFDGAHLPWDAGKFDLAILSHVVVELPTEDIRRRAKDSAPDRAGLAPALATRHFCYHEALLATAEPEGRPDARPAGRSGIDAE